VNAEGLSEAAARMMNWPEWLCVAMVTGAAGWSRAAVRSALAMRRMGPANTVRDKFRHIGNRGWSGTLFPLTPALFLREREPQHAALKDSDDVRNAERLTRIACVTV